MTRHRTRGVLYLGLMASAMLAVDSAQAAPYFRYHLSTGDNLSPTSGPTWNVSTKLQDGETGDFYVATIPAANSSNGAAISYSAGTLPAGFSFDPVSRVISGSSSASGELAFPIKASNSSGSVEQVFTMNMSGAPNWSSFTTGVSGQTNTALSFVIPPATSTDGSPVTYTAVSLPAGFTFDPSSMTLTGTTTTAGSVQATFRASNASGSVQKTMLIYSTKAATSLSYPLALSHLVIGLPATTEQGSPTTTGIGSGATYSLASGSLPDGMTLDPSTGKINGQPTTAGASIYTVVVTDSAGNTAVSGNRIFVTPPPSLSYPDATAVWNTPKTVGIASPKNFIGTVSYSIVSAPPAFALVGSGNISFTSTGTPTLGDNTIVVMATDSEGLSASATFHVNINGSLSYKLPPALSTQQPYTSLAPSIAGLTPTSWGPGSGTLPPGMSIDQSTGQITGQPTELGSYQFSIAATDGSGARITSPVYSLTVQTAPVATLSYPDAIKSIAYGQNYTLVSGMLQMSPTLSGITAPKYTISGTYPFNAFNLYGPGGFSGYISANAGVYDYTVTATDSQTNLSVSTEISTVVQGSLKYALPTTLSTQEAFTSLTPTLYGLVASKWSVAAGSLPPGITIDSSSGALTGQPTQTGSFSFSIQAMGDSGQTTAISPTYTFNVVSSRVNTLSYPDMSLMTYGTYISPTTYTPTLTGFSTANYKLTGTAPLAFSYNVTGGFSGNIVAQAGLYDYTVTATDPTTGVTASANLHTQVIGQLTYSLASTISTQLPYSSNAPTLKGLTATSWVVTSGALPPGMSIDQSSGIVTGQATTPGNYTFAIQAIGDAGQVATSQTFSMSVVTDSLLSLSYPDTIKLLTIGATNSSITPTLTGIANPRYTLTGTMPYNWFNSSNGSLNGNVTTTPGTYSYTVTASDTSTNLSISKDLTSVVVGTLSYSLPTGLSTQDSFTSQPPTLKGMTAKQWSVSSGSLPDGLSIDQSTGSITGQATTAGTYNFSITATGSPGQTSTSPTYTLTISNDSLSSLSYPDSINTVIFNQNYGNISSGVTFVPTLTGISNPVYTVSGLYPFSTFNYAGFPGAFLGVVNRAPGTYTYTVTAKDSVTSLSTSKTITTVVLGSLSYSLPDTLSLQDSFTSLVPTKTGFTPSTWTVSTGSLPPGLSIDQSTGSITGQPTSTGTYSFTIGGSSTTGAMAISPTYTMNIQEAPSATLNYPDSISYATYGTTIPANILIPTLTGIDNVNYFISGAYPFANFNTSPLGSFSGFVNRAAGTYTYTVTAKNSKTNLSVSKTITTVVVGSLKYALPTQISTQQAYSSLAPTLTGMSGATYSVASGALPPGMSINTTTGALSGQATQGGNYTFAIVATGSAGQTATSPTYTMAVTNEQTYALSYPASINTLQYGQNTGTSVDTILFKPTLKGITNPVYKLSGTSPFPNFGYAVAGAFSGTITKSAMTYTYTVTATDSVTNESVSTDITTQLLGNLSYVLPSQISTREPFTSLAPTIQGVVGQKWSMASGTLPPGLSISSAGLITGQATTPGSYRFSIVAVNNGGGTATSPVYSMDVVDSAVASITYPDAIQSVSFGQDMGTSVSTVTLVPTVTGIQSPVYTVSGTHPFYTFNSYVLGSFGYSVTGRAGVYNYVVTARDPATNLTVSTPITTVVTGRAAYTTMPSTLTSGTRMGTINISVTGFGASSFAVTSGSLPPGITLNSGYLSGTPTTPGTYKFAITATGSGYSPTSATTPIYTVTVQ